MFGVLNHGNRPFSPCSFWTTERASPLVVGEQEDEVGSPGAPASARKREQETGARD